MYFGLASSVIKTEGEGAKTIISFVFHVFHDQRPMAVQVDRHGNQSVLS
jgi:hypothetical protein